MVALPDTTNIEPRGAFTLLPRGWYPVEITSSENKPTSNGEGSYIELEMSILDGDYANQKLWDRLNLENKNDQTVDIAKRTLAAICHAIGRIGVTDSNQLHNKAMLADVRVRAARTDKNTGKTYDESNEIKGYKAINADAQPARTPAATAAPTGAKPPWRK